MVDKVRPLFRLGRIVGTPPALAALEAAGEDATIYLNRHRYGDWGTVDAEDAKQNNVSAIHQERVHSAYKLSTGIEIWIITEWDRSVTTILLPDDY